MNKYYEVKVRLERTLENGMTKKVKESYLFDALSFSEAEERAIEELAPFASGELEVTDIKRVPYSEIFPSDKEDADKWYEIRTVFLELNGRTGKTKKIKTDFLIQAVDIYNAKDDFNEVMRPTMIDHEIVSIKETPIMDVFPYQEKGERE